VGVEYWSNGVMELCKDGKMEKWMNARLDDFDGFNTGKAGNNEKLENVNVLGT
jgi:hypothetical protein